MGETMFYKPQPDQPENKPRRMSIAPAFRCSAVAEVLANVSLSDVWCHLGGPALRRTRDTTWRGRAWWRDVDGLNIALNDAKGTWYDFREAKGDGILDLIALVRGGNRQ